MAGTEPGHDGKGGRSLVTSALARTLPDGRLHLQDGPIDLVIGLAGTRPAVAEARARATEAFQGLLMALVQDLPLLRAPAGPDVPPLRHPVAQRMARAVRPFRAGFITPMAAVAGSVADHVLSAISGIAGLATAYVNNGGDIALHLAPGECLHVGLVRSLRVGAPQGLVRVAAAHPVRGIATSGWPGRSFSLGVADAVTVLAATAAEADAAATIIANAVNVDHPLVRRAPARSLDPDSDLGDLLVTTEVPPLPEDAVEQALDAGEAVAERLHSAGLIHSALLAVGDATRSVGPSLVELSPEGTTGA